MRGSTVMEAQTLFRLLTRVKTGSDSGSGVCTRSPALTFVNVTMNNLDEYGFTASQPPCRSPKCLCMTAAECCLDTEREDPLARLFV